MGQLCTVVGANYFILFWEGLMLGEGKKATATFSPTHSISS